MQCVHVDSQISCSVKLAPASQAADGVEQDGCLESNVFVSRKLVILCVGNVLFFFFKKKEKKTKENVIQIVPPVIESFFPCAVRCSLSTEGWKPQKRCKEFLEVAENVKNCAVVTWFDTDFVRL